MSSNNWQASYQQYSERFSQLQQREKVLISLSTIVAIALLAFSLFIDPNLQAHKQQQAQLNNLTLQLDQLKAQATEYQTALQVDINLPLSQQIQQLEQKLAIADQNIAQFSDQLVTAKQMSQMLEAMLSQTKSLKLIQLQSLPPLNLLSKTEPENTTQQPAQLNKPKFEIGLYQQGISLTIEGDYQSIYQFLQQVETLPWRFYWRNFNYQVTQYPKARLDVNLMTFSLTKGFVSL